MKYQIKLAIASFLLCGYAYATPIYQPPGSNLTYGSSSNNQSIMSSIANPAAAAAQLGREDSQLRFGLINLGGGYEIGNVNALFDKVDQASKDIKTPISTTDIAGLCAPSCTAATLAPKIANFINTSAATASVNSVLSAVQKDGNATVFFGGQVPFTPLVVTRKGWGGSIVFEANANVIANMAFIADPFAISDATALLIADAYFQSLNNTTALVLPPIPNDSTMLVKAAGVTELGLGYSRSIFRREAAAPVEGEPEPGKLSADQLKSGDLTAGVRVKYYRVKLANRAVHFTDNTTNGSQDTLNEDLVYTNGSSMGLDVGTLWTSKHYRAGAWINNLNSPKFKYPAIDVTGYQNTAIVSQLSAEQTYTMKPQMQLEGAIYSESQNIVANLGLDANAVKDPVGRDFQWATLSAGYATSSWWIPGIRIGYRSNLAGTKLSYMTGGLTLFKALSLDVAYGKDKVTDKDGKSIPRSAMVNLGIQMTF